MLNPILMKLLFLKLSLFLLLSSAQSQGIEFYHGSWEEALVEAQKKDKIIFVDAYAKWCGPCKKMAREVFTQEKVGKFFNDNFINLKLDMEEKEGLSFGRNYPISAFPTLFFLDSDGNILKKSVGGKQAEQLLSLANNAIKSYDRSDQYAEQYEAGERDYDLVLNYIKELNKVGKPSLKIANDYLADAPDISDSQKALFLLEAVLEADSKLFEELVSLRDEAIKISDEEAYETVVANAAMRTVEKAVEYDYADLVDDAIKQFNAAKIGDAKRFEREAYIYYHALMGQYDQWKELSEKFLKKYGKKNPVIFREHLSQIKKYFSFEDASKAYSYELCDKLIKYEATDENYMLYTRMLMNDKEFEKAYRLCKEAVKRFEDSPIHSQFAQMLDFLEKYGD